MLLKPSRDKNPRLILRGKLILFLQHLFSLEAMSFWGSVCCDRRIFDNWSRDSYHFAAHVAAKNKSAAQS